MLLARAPAMILVNLALASASLLAACDTRCVGPACTDQPPLVADTGTDDTDDTDTPSGDDPADLRDESSGALPMQRDCDVVRLHRPPPGTSTVQIAGSFNGWEPADLEGPDDDGWFAANLGPLSPGPYPYKYLYDGAWESSIPTSAELQWEGGIENRGLRVGDCSRPLLRVATAEATPDGSLEVVVRYARGSDGAPLDPARVRATVGGSRVTPTIDTDAQTVTITATGLPAGKHSVSLTVVDTDDNAGENSTFTPLWVEDAPFQWTDGPMYLAFTDRFRNGDTSTDSAIPGAAPIANYMGGDFKGVLDALEDGYFTDLGVRSIWLSPWYDNPEGAFQGVSDNSMFTGYHGYWTVAGREVEGRFGDSEASAAERLKQVVDEAHRQGIRVVMDLVLNHVHDQHDYITEHPSWFGGGCVCGSFGCGWEDKAIECWFTPYMPDLDHTRPEITDQLIDDTLWWIREYDLDGLRIDAVKHMHRVMTVNLRHRVREAVEQGGGAPVYMVGETFTGGGAQQELTQRIGPFEMDAQFDFPFYWASRDVFAGGSSFQNLEGTIQAGLNAWGDAPMSPFAGNHDIGRLATAIAGNDAGPWGGTPDRMAGGGDAVTEGWLRDTIAMALTVTLTQPGVPLLYYGDEIGLAGSGDPDNRRLMSFEPYLSENQRTLLATVQRVGQARGELRALRRGDFVPMWASQDVFAFARTAGTDAAIVVVNRGNDRTTRIPVQGVFADGTVLRDRLVPGRTFTVSSGELVAAMLGNDSAILAP